MPALLCRLSGLRGLKAIRGNPFRAEPSSCPSFDPSWEASSINQRLPKTVSYYLHRRRADAPRFDLCIWFSSFLPWVLASL